LGAGRLPIVSFFFIFLYKHFGLKGIGLIKDGEFEVYIDRGNIDSTQLVVSGCYAPFETEVFKSVIKEGMTVLDMGANIGHFTLIAARLVGVNGKVYAFEPTPITFGLLEKNVDKYEFQNVTLVNKAVFDVEGVHKFYTVKGFEAANSLGIGRNVPNYIEVPTIRLDNFLNGISVDVIKMDMEGAEFYAMQGMKRLLARSSSLKLFTEVDWKCLEGMGVSLERYIKELLKYFTLSVIVERKKQLIPCVNVTQIKEAFAAKSHNREAINLYCERRSYE